MSDKTNTNSKPKKAKYVAIGSGILASIAICAIAICMLCAPQLAPNSINDATGVAASTQASSTTPATSSNKDTQANTSSNKNSSTTSHTNNKTSSSVLERIVDTFTNNNNTSATTNTVNSNTTNESKQTQADTSQNQAQQNQDNPALKTANAQSVYVGTGDSALDAQINNASCLQANCANDANDSNDVTIWWTYVPEYEEKGEGYDNTLYLSSTTGTGSYINKVNDTKPAWYQYNNKITKVVINDEIKPVNMRSWFSNHTGLGSAQISFIESFDGLGNINTANVVDASYAFCTVGNTDDPTGEERGQVVDASALSTNFSSLTNATAMFSGSSCVPATITTSALENAQCMFSGIKLNGNGSPFTSLDISGVTLADSANIESMFARCLNLATITAKAGTDWSNMTGANVFAECTNLEGGNGTKWNSSNISATYARNDGGPSSSTPGYFTYVPVSSISLADSAETIIPVGDTVTLKPAFNPANASNKGITWTSSNESVASVDSTGKIAALTNGSTTITATSNDNTEIKASCYVSVGRTLNGIAVQDVDGNLTFYCDNDKHTGAHVLEYDTTNGVGSQPDWIYWCV